MKSSSSTFAFCRVVFSIAGAGTAAVALGASLWAGNPQDSQGSPDTNLTSQEPLSEEGRDLLFPFFRGNAATFSGYAVTNYSDEAAEVEMEARDAQGELLPFPDNPHVETILGRSQTARVGSEFFNIDPATVQEGWIRMTSETAELASFFQFGDVVNKLDGAVAFTEQSQVLYFTRLYEGEHSFPTVFGSREVQTFLSIANPNPEPVSLTFFFYEATTNPQAVTAERNLPAQGVLYESLASIFDLNPNVDNGFVRVDVEGPGAVGLALIELEDTVLALNASFPGEDTVSYSAQLASGDAGGISFFTSIKIVNTAGEPREVQLTAYRDDGTLIGVHEDLNLGPNESLQAFANTLFDLGSVFDPATVGSLKIEASGPGVLGDVVFGDPVNVRFAAALPLQTQVFTRAIFSQVASGPIAPGDEDLTFFTGVALFNPNEEAAEVTIQVYGQDGTLVGETSPPVVLEPNERISDVIGSLVPDVQQLLGGYIVVESTHLLVAQQLFGNASLTFLSAVPPTVVE